MNQKMQDMTRYMRYIRNLSTDMKGVSTYVESMDRTMRRLNESTTRSEVAGHLRTLESELSEMRKAVSGNRLVEGADDMERAMTGMSKSMSAFKGNAPSHDYSVSDGEFSGSEEVFDDEESGDEEIFDESDDSDDSEDPDDMDGTSDDDDMEESVKEYVADLRQENQTLREHNEQLRATLKKVGAAYVMATNSYGIAEENLTEFMADVNRKSVDDFERLRGFEEHVEGIRSGFLTESANPKFTPDPLSLLAKPQDLSLTEGVLFSNIKRLSGAY